MQVNVECDLRQLIADGKKAEKALQKAFGELTELAYWTFEKLIDLTPKSGHTTEGFRVADSWELKFQHFVLGRELAWNILSDNEIIGYLEYGTTEHWIYPKSPGGVLHWTDPATGEDYFSAGHIVSGISPVGMIRQTETEVENEIDKIEANATIKISN